MPKHSNQPKGHIVNWIDQTPPVAERFPGEEVQEILALANTELCVAYFGWEEDAAWGVFEGEINLVRSFENKSDAMAYAEYLAERG